MSALVAGRGSRRPVALAIALCLASCIGCDGRRGGGGPGGGDPDAGSMPPPPEPVLSCLEVLQCIVECPEGDMPCLEACYARGTPPAMSEVYDLGTCIDTNTCVEESCVTTYCATELGVCVGASVPPNTGMPLPPAPPPGSVPPDLVGSWAGASMGATERIVVNADGTGSRMWARSTRISACYSYTALTKTGTFVIDDATITLYATTVEQTVRECAPPGETTFLAPVVDVTPWRRRSDPNTITVIDADCAARGAGDPGNIEFYCSYHLMRE